MEVLENSPVPFSFSCFSFVLHTWLVGREERRCVVLGKKEGIGSILRDTFLSWSSSRCLTYSSDFW